MDNSQAIADMLNGALNSDEKAVQELFDSNITCNDKLADDPFIEVSPWNTVNPIGVINGILNLLGEQKICFIVRHGKIIGFKKYEVSPTPTN